MLPYQLIAAGSFTSDSTQQHQVALNDTPDLFFLENRTNWGDASAVNALMSQFRRGFAQGSAKITDQTAATNALATGALVTANGFTFIDTSKPPSFAALATTAITGNAGTFVVSMASTADIFIGDHVRLYGTTGELQIAGYTFQVTAVTTNVSITLGYMASGGQTFAAAATAGSVKKYIPNLMYPRWSYIAGITKAAQAVVFFTAKNNYTPGEILSFRVSSAFGMAEMNNVSARVLSVTNSATVSSVTLDLDSSGFTTFNFPTSAIAAAGVSPAVCVPASSGVVPDNGSATQAQQPPGTNLLDTFDNRNKFVMHMGSSVITNSGSKYDWYAMKADYFTAE